MIKIISWWLTPKFPKKHIEIVLSYKPQGFTKITRNYYRTWFIHPIRRRLARFYCFLLQKAFGMKVVGITGSTGKTTTKEMLASILKLKGETVYSFANIDPVYNIPTTIFRCRPSTKYLILEMGVEFLNEMDFYLWLAKPDLGIITNIYPTHTLNFKNETGVLKEKSKLVKSLSKEKFAILNLENSFLQKLSGKIRAKIQWFGESTEIFATNIKYTNDLKTSFILNLDNKEINITLPILGKQFVSDALAASAGAYSLGIDINKIKDGLQSFEIQNHRMNIKRLKSGAILIDDSYNNNPEAAKEAIKILKDVSNKKKTMLIFGDMLELGQNEVKYHKEVGSFIRKMKTDCVIGIGRLSKHVVINPKFHFNSWQEALPAVRSLLIKNMLIMVKGSRSTNLDLLVNELR